MEKGKMNFCSLIEWERNSEIASLPHKSVVIYRTKGQVVFICRFSQAVLITNVTVLAALVSVGSEGAALQSLLPE